MSDSSDSNVWESHLDDWVIEAMAQGRYAQACAQLSTMLAVAPEDPQLHYAAGAVYAQQQDYGQAEQHWRMAQALAPGWREVSFDLGLLYVSLNRPEDARTVLRGLVMEESQDPVVEYAKGLWAILEGAWPEAGERLRRGMAADRGNGPRRADLQRVMARIAVAMTDAGSSEHPEASTRRLAAYERHTRGAS